jgi:hypothetical protein
MKNFLFLFLLLSLHSFSQDVRTIRFTSSHTSFPDTARAKGHLYNKVLYDAAEHYNDSSVIIFIPPTFRAGSKVNMVFWFHGWQNNITNAAAGFDLINQFVASGMNAVLVLAETAKNAPDSYGGKLERKDEFNWLVQDVLLQMKMNAIIKTQKAGDIILAGHSGGYRVMAYILQNGNVPVKGVFLFDALYSETDKYINWLKEDRSRRLINIYTDGGGTDAESKEMVKKLQAENITALSLEETDITLKKLKRNRVVVMHSLHAHNDVIKKPDNFRLFLESAK